MIDTLVGYRDSFMVLFLLGCRSPCCGVDFGLVMAFMHNLCWCCGKWIGRRATAR
jgi:hypothetical protein